MEYLKKHGMYFFIAIVISILYAFVSADVNGEEKTVKTIYINFASAIVIFYGLHKAITSILGAEKIKSEFKDVKGKLTDLVDKLEDKTDHLLNSIVGAGYCYLIPTPKLNNDEICISIVSHSKYSIYDLNISCFEVGRFTKDRSNQIIKPFAEYNHNFPPISHVLPGHIIENVIKIQVIGNEKEYIQYHLTHKGNINGYYEDFTIVKIDGGLYWAYRIVDQANEIYSYGKDKIPGYNEENLFL